MASKKRQKQRVVIARANPWAEVEKMRSERDQAIEERRKLGAELSMVRLNLQPLEGQDASQRAFQLVAENAAIYNLLMLLGRLAGPDVARRVFR